MQVVVIVFIPFVPPACFICLCGYSRSSRKRTRSGRDKNVRNWSWPLTRMVLLIGH